MYFNGYYPQRSPAVLAPILGSYNIYYVNQEFETDIGSKTSLYSLVYLCYLGLLLIQGVFYGFDNMVVGQTIFFI